MSIETTLPYNYNSKNNSYTIIMQLSLTYNNYCSIIPLEIRCINKQITTSKNQLVVLYTSEL